MARPMDLIACDCWDRGERLALPRQFDNLIFFDPLFIYHPQKGISIYYNFSDPKQGLEPIFNYLENNISLFIKRKVKFDIYRREIKSIITKRLKNSNRLYFLIQEIWPIIALSNIFGGTKIFKVSQKLRKTCFTIRVESEGILHPAMTYLSNITYLELGQKNRIPPKYFPYLLPSEKTKSFPSKNELARRTHGYLFHRGKIYLNIKKYLTDNDIILKDNTKEKIDADIIKGQSACRGKAQGKARVVFELSDLNKVKKGDILITPMTTADMMVALRRAAGIVTDEGGITCHAAIVSRELKTPCVISTKIATKFITDNDLVKVDGNNGIVQITRK